MISLIFRGVGLITLVSSVTFIDVQVVACINLVRSLIANSMSSVDLNLISY